MNKKVIIWSDNHNFPSLPAMKISAWHKSNGDQVELFSDHETKCDIFYECKAFSFTQPLQYVPKYDINIQGGSGYAIKVIDGKEEYDKNLDPMLSNEIENQYPDYELYPAYQNTAYGFLTRGCPNNCSFCVVSKKEGRCTRQVSELSGFWNGQKQIKLMDGNLLASQEREKLLQSIIESKANIDYTQGLDARFITDDIARLICKTKIKMLHFAFDFMKNESAIIKGLQAFKRHSNKTDRELRVYILTNYNTSHAEDYYRVRKVIELGYQPYVMIYQKGTHGRFLTDLARWCNTNFLYRSCSFEDYTPRVDGRSCKQLYGHIIDHC